MFQFLFHFLFQCKITEILFNIFDLQKLWPSIKSEMILMDYLFDPKHKVNESEAALIAVLLIDLQQDFRTTIKRSILMDLLR